MDDRTPLDRDDARLERQFRLIGKDFPWARTPLQRLRNPRLFLFRLPLAIVMILGGFLAILPFFGLWMIPFGLLLLAIDIPKLRGPVSAALIQLRRKLNGWRRKPGD